MAKKANNAAAQKAPKAEAPKPVELTERALVFRMAEAVKNAENAKASVVRAQERVQGAYTALTAIAAEEGEAHFKTACNELMAAVRVDHEGLAKVVKAKTNEDGTGYKVPSSISTAKTVILAAFKLATPLVDEEGKPRPFTHIREDNKKARQAIVEDGMSDEDRTLVNAIEAVRSLTEGLATYKPVENSKGAIVSHVDSAMADKLEELTSWIAQWVKEFDDLSGVEEEDDSEERDVA